MLPNQAFAHAFTLLNGIGPARLEKLLVYTHGDSDKAWQLFPSIAPLCFGPDVWPAMLDQWRTIDVAKEYERVGKLGISIVCPEQAEYPELLRQIHQPPIALYYKGRLNIPADSITVVGTRRSTDYGRSCVRRLLSPLPKDRAGIISGLAFGIDAEAHKVAIQHGLFTMAVLASGVDIITPNAHQRLAQQILDSGGCILSEFPPGTIPSEGSFPRRNRILAGLTRFTLVVEATSDSGSLITARKALFENREVGVVPGPIYSPTSAGCFDLLAQGARLVRSSKDILDFYNVSANSPRSAPALTEAESAFAAFLESTPLSLDALIAKSGLNASQAMILLTELELKGAIRSVPGRGYVIDG